jgi:hypothetical protein
MSLKNSVNLIIKKHRQQINRIKKAIINYKK